MRLYDARGDHLSAQRRRRLCELRWARARSARETGATVSGVHLLRLAREADGAEVMPCHPDRVRRNYPLPRLEELERRMANGELLSDRENDELETLKKQ